MSTPLLRPAPASPAGARPLDRRAPPDKAAAWLADGGLLVLEDRYGVGADVLDALQRRMPVPEGGDHAARQSALAAHRAVAKRLLAPVRDGRIDVEDGASIGFLEDLYPGPGRTFLPLVHLQDMWRAWQRYTEGVPMAVLGQRIHPFYGTYAPERTIHLELFATWLAQHTGPRERAVDVGTGSGILALMLAKAGFARVRATDRNPNATLSVDRECDRRDPRPPIDTATGDLLCDTRGPVDLVVFNPPWVPGPVHSPLDAALVYDDPGLFGRFFDQAAAALAPTGRVVLLFSNIASLVLPDAPHPIEAELARGRFTLVQKLQRRVKPAPGPGGRRRTTKERVEVWELALRS